MSPRVQVFTGRAAQLIAQQAEDMGDLQGRDERLLQLRTFSPTIGVYTPMKSRLLVMAGECVVELADLMETPDQPPELNAIVSRFLSRDMSYPMFRQQMTAYRERRNADTAGA